MLILTKFGCSSVNPPENPMCQNNEGDNQWALTFDPSYQYPDGPVCDWPSTLACHCDLTTDPDKECCLDTDCPPQPDGCPDSFCLGYKCGHLDCNQLCSQDSDCPGHILSHITTSNPTTKPVAQDPTLSATSAKLRTETATTAERRRPARARIPTPAAARVSCFHLTQHFCIVLSRLSD